MLRAPLHFSSGTIRHIPPNRLRIAGEVDLAPLSAHAAAQPANPSSDNTGVPLRPAHQNSKRVVCLHYYLELWDLIVEFSCIIHGSLDHLNSHAGKFMSI